jgi:MFS family permease
VSDPTPVPKSPLREITQPFIDLVHAPRALWAVNLSSLVEGFVYFGMLASLTFYFNQYARLGDKETGWMVGLLTAGITICMLFFGGRADKWGVRRTFLISILIMLVGRSILAFAPGLGLASGGLFTPFNALAAFGILFIVLGYGMYYPAGYAAIRQFTTPATASMGFAMLYAVMNLGGWLPTFMAPVRRRFEISGAYGFYVAASALGLVVLFFLLNRKTEQKALAEAKLAAQAAELVAQTEGAARNAAKAEGAPDGFWPRIFHWLRNHPIADAKFAYFIFCLIPVQTLFAYNYFILPPYVKRAFAGTWIGDNYEVATQFNSLLIFVLCPIVAALTARAKVYRMMILGTAVMAAPTFLLALGPTVPGLFAFLVLMTLGEAMWQPRFLQYAAEIAPEGRTGAYMGVAQFPWFLTKIIVPLYSGAALSRWCPATGPGSTGTMWLVFGGLAMMSTILLILAKGWLGKDFKTKA